MKEVLHFLDDIAGAMVLMFGAAGIGEVTYYSFHPPDAYAIPLGIATLLGLLVPVIAHWWYDAIKY